MTPEGHNELGVSSPPRVGFLWPLNRLSMFDLLTPDESRHAAACGWQLNTVYDMNKERWALEVMPCDHPKTSAYHTQARVVGLARTGDAVAMRALQLVVRSYQPPKPNRKKAKPHDSKAPAR